MTRPTTTGTTLTAGAECFAARALTGDDTAEFVRSHFVPRSIG